MTRKKYQVIDNYDIYHTVYADFVMEQDGKLIFKVGSLGNSEVVALFAAGRWASFQRMYSEDTKSEPGAV